jgi:hypothetical protein
MEDSVHLHAALRALHVEVRSKKYQASFEQARARHPSLSPFTLPAAILAALDLASCLAVAEKDRLTRALVTEFAEHPSPLWLALLVLAYSPMLLRLRARVRASAVPSPDLDQIVLASFLQVVGDFRAESAEGHTCAALRRSTERRVFEAVRKLHRDLTLVEPVEPSDLDELPRAVADTAWRATMRDLPRLADHLERAADGAVKREDIDLVVHTLIGQQSLPQYVRQRYPEIQGADRHLLYERLRRARSRAVQRLQRPPLVRRAQAMLAV